MPKINGNPEYETDEDGELNDKPGANDGGEEKCFVDIFRNSQKTCKQRCRQTRKRELKGGNPNLLSALYVMCKCSFYILCRIFENG